MSVRNIYYIIQSPLLQGEVLVLVLDNDTNTGLNTFDIANVKNLSTLGLADLVIGATNDNIQHSPKVGSRLEHVVAYRCLDSVLEFINTSSSHDFARPVIEHYKIPPWVTTDKFQFMGDVDDHYRVGLNPQSWIDFVTKGASGNYLPSENLGPRLDQCTLEGKKSFKLPPSSDMAHFKDLTKCHIWYEQLAAAFARFQGSVGSYDALDPKPGNLVMENYAIEKVIENRLDMSKCFNVFKIENVDPGFIFNMNTHVYNEYVYGGTAQRLNHQRSNLGGMRKPYTKRGPPAPACDDEFERPAYKRQRR